MRMNYRIYPVDYVEELNKKGLNGAKKAMAFLSYWHCIEMGDYHSTRFHAKKWGVSPSTGHTWMKEFDDEIDLFRAHWDIKKQASDNNIKKLNEQNERSQSSKSSSYIDDESGICELPAEQIEQTQSSKELNINNNINSANGYFQGFYFLYRQFNKYAGSKNECEQAFANVDDADYKSLSIAAVLYLKDQSIDKKVGAKKFLENKIYLNYLDMNIRVFVGGQWLSGIYDPDNEVFIDADNKSYKLTAMKLAEKMEREEIQIMSGAAA